MSDIKEVISIGLCHWSYVEGEKVEEPYGLIEFTDGTFVKITVDSLAFIANSKFGSEE